MPIVDGQSIIEQPGGPDFSGNCSVVVWQYQPAMSNYTFRSEEGLFRATYGWPYTNPTENYFGDFMLLDSRKGWISWTPGVYLPPDESITIPTTIGHPLPFPLLVQAGTHNDHPLSFEYQGLKTVSFNTSSLPAYCEEFGAVGDWVYGIRRRKCSFTC